MVIPFAQQYNSNLTFLHIQTVRHDITFAVIRCHWLYPESLTAWKTILLPYVPDGISLNDLNNIQAPFFYGVDGKKLFDF